MRPNPLNKDSGKSLPDRKDIKAGLEDLLDAVESRSVLSDSLMKQKNSMNFTRNSSEPESSAQS